MRWFVLPFTIGITNTRSSPIIFILHDRFDEWATKSNGQVERLICHYLVLGWYLCYPLFIYCMWTRVPFPYVQSSDTRNAHDLLRSVWQRKNGMVIFRSFARATLIGQPSAPQRMSVKRCSEAVQNKSEWSKRSPHYEPTYSYHTIVSKIRCQDEVVISAFLLISNRPEQAAEPISRT